MHKSSWVGAVVFVTLSCAVAAQEPDVLSASEWSSIRAAYDAGRHSAHAVDGGQHFRARNPGQRWRMLFDGCGFEATPDAGDWSWGLQLVRYGRAGAERVVHAPICIDAVGGRVSYEWHAALTEWFINDTRGLEHGFTVHQPPPAARRSAHAFDTEQAIQSRTEELLRLTLAVRGDLMPRVSAGARSVAFVDANGASVVNYNGLIVFDADGTVLDARFELPVASTGDDAAHAVSAAPHTLVLVVDDRGARYPLTIDPIAQQAYLKASNTDEGDLFGGSVAVSGDTVVIGALGEDSRATGVNGDQADNSAPDSGAVYVFVRDGATWVQQAYLKASNSAANAYFGFPVAISGDTIVVGAQREGSLAALSGAAYVFVRAGTSWSQQAQLKAANANIGDRFGFAVSISGDTVAVGARYEDSSAIGVNGDSASNSAADSGAAYVFVRDNDTWIQQVYLKASNTGADDQFGTSVTVSGDMVVVGAFIEDSNATGVNGNQADNSMFNSGAAYVFVRNGASWSQEAYLKASNTGWAAYFGYPVALSGNTLVVGAYGERSGATGVNGNQADWSAPSAGAAYVFVRDGSTWLQQAYLKASNTGTNDWFGYGLSISGDTVVAGAPNEASGSAGVNGNQANNLLSSSGAAYVFLREGTEWNQAAYLKASNPSMYDQFGQFVVVSGALVAVGAYGEASSSTGVNGNQADNSIYEAGAVYLFEPGVLTWCAADLDGDDTVGGADLALVLGHWGTSGAPGLTGDANLDGIVNGADLAAVLGSWGACPR